MLLVEARSGLVLALTVLAVSFLSYSAVAGVVGGGGIGLELSRWINQLQWNNAATAVWAIVIVVLLMDWASTEVRSRIT